MMSFREQIRNNAVALISLVIAIGSLGYNTWRNETTEEQRNIRHASFRVLESLGELQEIVDMRFYYLPYDQSSLSEGESRILGFGTAAMVRDFDVSKRVEGLYIALVLGAALVYAPIVGDTWAWNPLASIVPAAYEVKYLVIAAIASNAVMGSQFLIVNEMMAAGRARALTILEALATPLRLLAAASAVAIGAFALPVSQIVNGFNVMVGLIYMYRVLYGLGAKHGLRPEAEKQPSTS